MSSGDLTDLIGEVESLPAGDTDLEINGKGQSLGARHSSRHDGLEVLPGRVSRGYTLHLHVICFKSQ